MARFWHFITLPLAEQGRTIEAFLYLLTMRLAFKLLGFARALRLLGIVQGEAGPGRVAAPEVRKIGRAVARAARHAPFHAVCMQQAFAALLMLRRRGLAATVHFGVARDGARELSAHAWSRCGGVPVTGNAEARGFVPIAVFTA